MSLLTDKIVKGNEEPVTIADLQQLTADTRSNVIDSLQHLQEIGWLKIVDGDWPDAGSLRIEGFTIELGIDQRTLAHEPVSPESLVKNDRDVTGYDEIAIAGKTYNAEVEYDGEAVAGKFTLTIKTATGDDPLEEAFLGDFESKERAWLHFDNYVQKDSRGDTRTQVYRSLGGTKWEMSLEPNEKEDAPLLWELTIKRTHPDEATSTTVLEEVFDTEREAWEHVDEYLGPVETEIVEAEEVKVEVAQ